LKSSQPALQVARGSTYLIASNVANTAVSVGAFAIIARLISREEMGILAVLLLLVAAVQVLAGLGLGVTATKLVASFDAMEERDKMRRTSYSCLIINVLATTVLVVALYLSADRLAVFLLGSSSNANLLRLLTLEIAATSVNGPLVSVLAGLKRFREISLVSVTAFATRQILVVFFLELGLGLPGLVIGYGIGDSLNSLALFGYTRKFLGALTADFGFTHLLKFSAPLLIRDAASFAWTWFDRALLLPLVALSQLGAYNVAVTAFGILNSAPQAISGTLFPYYSHFYPDESKTAKTEDLENAVTKASRYVSLFTIPLCLGLAATALPATTLLAGNIYADAAYPLAILSVSLAAGCLVRALSEIFVVLGRAKTSAAVTITSVFLSVLVGVALVPSLGILGASVARGASLLIALGLSIPFLRRILKLGFDMRAYRSAWLASLLMTGSVLAFEQILYSKYLLPAYIAVGGAVFFSALRPLHAINQEDVQLVSDFLGVRFSFLVEWARRFLGVEAEKGARVFRRQNSDG